MISHGIDVLKNSRKWKELWTLLAPWASPFFAPEYYMVSLGSEQAEAECFWAVRDEDNFVFYPYLRKSINSLGYDLDQDYYDISGAYGYNGPLGRASDPIFLDWFNNSLLEHFSATNVVTEFVRYCPLSGNRMLHTYTEQTDVLDNVYVDLTGGAEYVWERSFEYRVRKTVRKGMEFGLKTVIRAGGEIAERDIDALHSIYISTMSRNEADRWYYFSRECFADLVTKMDRMALLALTYLEEKAISAELVLTAGKLAFGFLGGTLREYYEYKANSFQRWELIKHLVALGFTKYSMGGGSARGDSIYKFKLSFAQDCVNPFYIGTKVHLPAVYDEILRQWRSKFPKAAMAHSSMIQGYRRQEILEI